MPRELTERQQRNLREIARVVAQQAKLERRRDALILEAAEDLRTPRALIAEAAQLSEPQVYKIRRDELKRREQPPEL
ncbi:hypothetical protein [Nocardia wallacei]|uniref:Uncharacterized protein n=1 Tax=Nocardia wallacei TaxID=480035 RepID=A0A7G1KT40_9NOCA|nr:hypothetical protein [Nocardia wallacei]BCK58330.1 hypothetical protein NWFMUON74_61020 [Nocardia wallacei]